MKERTISLRVTEEWWSEAKHIGKREQRTASQIVRLALDHYLYLYRVTGTLPLDHIEDADV